jgi:hypothetical protein
MGWPGEFSSIQWSKLDSVRATEATISAQTLAGSKPSLVSKIRARLGVAKKL